MKKTHAAITDNNSAFARYRQVIVGSDSILCFLYFEFCLLFTYIPGAVGMVLRKLLWPRLFKSCGRGVLFGCGIVLRHPRRVVIGDKVVISDGCVLDGRNGEQEVSIVLGDNVMISNDVTLSCKDGYIEIGDDVSINSQTIIQSTNNCPVRIGRDGIIGQRCFIVGGGSYNIDDLKIPIRKQGIRYDGGVTIEENVWLGGNVTVLGGVEIGHGSILAASTVMIRPVPPLSLCRGVPGKVYGSRDDSET